MTTNNWNSWWISELVVSVGNYAGIGEPTLTKNGDISFFLVYEDPNANSIYNHLPTRGFFKKEIRQQELTVIVGRHWLYWLIDRVNLREGKEQIYGSQLYGNSDGTYYVKDLFDPEYVNQRRKSVGLEPIESYIARWNVVWKTEQKEK